MTKTALLCVGGVAHGHQVELDDSAARLNVPTRDHTGHFGTTTYERRTVSNRHVLAPVGTTDEAIIRQMPESSPSVH